jgi:molybdate transport system substrate-binding protein
MVFKKLIVLLLLVHGMLFAKSVNVAVAANVSYAIKDLVKEFNKLYPDIKVRVVLGSSGKLTAQIKNKAPIDIFMSADMRYPEALYSQKIATTKPTVYAQGVLALLSVKKRDFSKGIDILKDKSIRVIAISNPKTAPYGIAAMEALKGANLLQKVKAKFVYGESVSQTISYSVTAADIGLVAKSALFSPKMTAFKETQNWIEIDRKTYTPINQGVVIIRGAKGKKGVSEFYNFLLSKKAQNIFKHFGYIMP